MLPPGQRLAPPPPQVRDGERRFLAVTVQAEWSSLVVSWCVRFSVLGEGGSDPGELWEGSL